MVIKNYFVTFCISNPGVLAGQGTPDPPPAGEDDREEQNSPPGPVLGTGFFSPAIR